MLDLLKIKNVALIDEMTVDFSSGFNVLIGETGAGKSIIIDALSFVLGDKVDKELLRYGEKQMRVEAVFSGCNSNKDLCALLDEFGIVNEDDGLVLSRTYNDLGKSDCRVNGSLVSVSMLKRISACLIDIYGQHDNQVLLKDKNHLSILDSFDEKETSYMKNEISDLLSKIKNVEKEIAEIGGSKEERERKLDLLSYQIEEIEKASIKEGEEEDIRSRITTLSNAEKISEGLANSLSLLDGGSFSALENIKSSIRNLSSVSNYDEFLKKYETRLVDLQYELGDISDSLSDYSKQLVFNQAEFDALDSRLDKIKNLKKKYGSSLEIIVAFLSEAKNEREKLLRSEEILQQLTSKKNEIYQSLVALCEKLSKYRKAMAQEIEKQTIKELAELGMKSTSFKIYFATADEPKHITYSGFDDVSFLFSANEGQELKSLSKTISGGEMSRFMLALKNVIRHVDASQSVIFDEVDTGISGAIAVMVGKKIATISKIAQVLCITHLPQVCAMADNVFFVSKHVKDGQTVSSIRQLNEEEIITEIALMAGGDRSAQKANSYAQELRQISLDYKKQIV